MIRGGTFSVSFPGKKPEIKIDHTRKQW